MYAVLFACEIETNRITLVSGPNGSNFCCFFNPGFLAITICSAYPPRQAEGCRKACPHIYDPVCGTDGETYKVFASECTMEDYNCQRENSNYCTLKTFWSKSIEV